MYEATTLLLNPSPVVPKNSIIKIWRLTTAEKEWRLNNIGSCLEASNDHSLKTMDYLELKLQHV